MDGQQLRMLKEGLAASPVFGGMDGARISEICDRLGGDVDIVCFGAGERVSSAGRANDSVTGGTDGIESGITGERKGGALGTVLGGRLTVSRTPADGQESVVLNVLGKGGCFGVCSLFSGAFRVPPTVITASEPSTVAFIGEQAFTALLLSDSEVCVAYLRFLTGRICFLNDKLHAFSGSTVNERVAQALLSAARSCEDGTLCFRGSMAELARGLNIARASLYRALDAMSGKGLIVRRGKTVGILHPEALSCFK